MFAVLKNQFKLTFTLKVDSPLCIKNGDDTINPTLPDMQCMRSRKNGEDVVFIPGSSIKGIFRSQCEKIFNIVAEKKVSCDVLSDKSKCHKEKGTGKEVYKAMCPSCKMFGSKSLGGRIKFKDAYPENNNFRIGHRTCNSINRITGGAEKGALYDFEVVEDGEFTVTITGENYELYQLKTLMWVLEDIDEGYVAFGSASTRGNGKMKVKDFNISIRDYRKNTTYVNGYNDEDKGEKVEYTTSGYYKEVNIDSINEVMKLLNNVDINNSIRG